MMQPPLPKFLFGPCLAGPEEEKTVVYRLGELASVQPCFLSQADRNLYPGICTVLFTFKRYQTSFLSQVDRNLYHGICTVLFTYKCFKTGFLSQADRNLYPCNCYAVFTYKCNQSDFLSQANLNRSYLYHNIALFSF